MAVDAVDLFLLESGTAVQMWVGFTLFVYSCKNNIVG